MHVALDSRRSNVGGRPHKKIVLIQQIFFAVASVEHVTRFLMKRLFCSTGLKKEKGGSVWAWHVQHVAMSLMARFKATREAKEQECARRESCFSW